MSASRSNRCRRAATGVADQNSSNFDAPLWKRSTVIVTAFLFAYRLAWIVLTPLVLAYLWLRGRRDRMYRAHLGERFARYPALPQNPVWIHAVSLGEVRSAVPLARDLLATGETIVFTHHTPAGRKEARRVFAEEIAAGRVASVWGPMDMLWCYRRLFRTCRPKIGLTMEIEIWPAMILAAKRGGVPLYMCNAQYPDKSLARDSRGLRLRHRIMADFAGAFVKSRLQADRFESVGVPNVQITGELRFDQPIPAAQVEAARVAATLIPDRTVIAFTSAVEGEDGLYLDVITDLLSRDSKPLILYIPRAPERFDAVAGLLAQARLRTARRSEVFDDSLRMRDGWPDDVDVLLGDSLGEMYFYLALATRVVAGGGFHPKGAHNVIEPLALGKPVVTGPNIHTIEYPFVEAEAAGVALSVADGAALTRVLCGPDWTSPAAITTFLEAHSGASEKTAQAIRQVIER